jgi:chorismate dehydratase
MEAVLRVAAISFLNPAPLLYNFEHEPTASRLAAHYALHYTRPALSAQQLIDGSADLGLIPIASLTPELAVVPGCTIASLDEVRSILLLVKNPHGLAQDQALKQVRSIAADAASRSSQAYVRILFAHFLDVHPTLHEQTAEQPDSPRRMLAGHDAALLIGDPALLAREHRGEIDPEGQLLWLDLAQLWRLHTGLPWVAAVWAVRPAALTELRPTQLMTDLIASRDAGLAHIPQLVEEWAPRLAIPRDTIRTYLSANIHYRLDGPCLQAMALFRELAAGIGALPPLPELLFLS